MKRAFLFGILGALVFWILGVILAAFSSGFKSSFLFSTEDIKLDLHIIAVIFRVNLFVAIGFVAGWAYCLFGKKER